MTLNSIPTLSRQDREIPQVSELKFHPVYRVLRALATNPPSLHPLTWAWLRWFTSGAFENTLPAKKKYQFMKWWNIIGRFTTFPNPWSDQLKTSFQLSITPIVHMETHHRVTWRVLSGTVSWSGLFTTVSRQDKTRTCKLHGETEPSNQWRLRSETRCGCSRRTAAGHKPPLRLQLNGTSGTRLRVKLSLPEI